MKTYSDRIEAEEVCKNINNMSCVDSMFCPLINKSCVGAKCVCCITAEVIRDRDIKTGETVWYVAPLVCGNSMYF